MSEEEKELSKEQIKKLEYLRIELTLQEHYNRLTIPKYNPDLALQNDYDFVGEEDQIEEQKEFLVSLLEGKNCIDFIDVRETVLIQLIKYHNFSNLSYNTFLQYGGSKVINFEALWKKKYGITYESFIQNVLRKTKIEELVDEKG